MSTFESKLHQIGYHLHQARLLTQHLLSSRELSLTITKIDEAMYWLSVVPANSEKLRSTPVATAPLDEPREPEA